MPLVVHNTRTQKREPFVPAHPRVVRIYTCGLTVYAPMHIGHARTYCFWDTFRRWLEYRGYHVLSVINYTDIDDRIMAAARHDGGDPAVTMGAPPPNPRPGPAGEGEGGRGCVDVAERMIAAFRSSTRALHIKDYAAYTRATDFVEEQVEMISRLIAAGHAYVKDGEAFYEVGTFPAYGQLSGHRVDEQEVGASGRVDEDFARKRHPADFTLWKPSSAGQPAWATGQPAFPSGRPGWHIECSAMSTALLGDHFDVHGGAVDNLFPHHENEVAQSQPLCGEPWVRYWLHPEHLDLRGVKMSKSLGNVIGVPDLLARHSADEVRWFYATHHYRTKLPFGWDLMEQAVAGYQRIKRLCDVLAERLLAGAAPPAIPARGDYASARPPEQRAPRARHTYVHGAFAEASARFIDRFVAAMDDDLDAPAAMAATFGYVNELYAAGVEQHPDPASLLAVYRCLTAHLAVFGIEIARLELHPELCADYAVAPASAEAEGRGGDGALDRLVGLRSEARKARDFAKADAIRKLLAEAGVEIEDTPQGPRWTVK